MTEFDVENGSLLLAQKITRNFDKADPPLATCTKSHFVRGALNLSHSGLNTKRSADCKVVVPANWTQEHPIVSCFSPWMIWKPEGNPDWHVYADHSLCWVLLVEWRKEIERLSSAHSSEAVLETASVWCLNNVKWLLYRHYIGYQKNYTKWPSNWPQWPHGNRAIREYLKAVNQG